MAEFLCITSEFCIGFCWSFSISLGKPAKEKTAESQRKLKRIEKEKMIFA